MGARWLLGREELIREALDRDWVPLLMGWLGADTRPAVQVEALWALTNIAAGAPDHAQVLTNSGAVPPLVVLLDSPNEEVCRVQTKYVGATSTCGVGVIRRVHAFCRVFFFCWRAARPLQMWFTVCVFFWTFLCERCMHESLPVRHRSLSFLVRLLLDFVLFRRTVSVGTAQLEDGPPRMSARFCSMPC